MRPGLIFSFIVLPFLGVAQKGFVRYDRNVNGVQVLEPVSSIFAVGKGLVLKVDPKLCEDAFLKTSSVLQHSFPDSIVTFFYSSDADSRRTIKNFIINFSNEYKSKRHFIRYRVPDSVLALFDTSRGNFVFFTYNTGIRKDPGNLSTAQRLLSSSAYFQGSGVLSVKSSIKIICFVVDLRRKIIVFYEEQKWIDRDPTDIKNIQMMLTRIIPTVSYNEYKNQQRHFPGIGVDC